MIDIQKLEELAKAAKEDWCNWWTIEQLEKRAVDGAGADFIVAASPAAVLELIAEAKRVPILKDMLERQRSAVTTLIHLGYTDKGGEQWKPPLGKKPDFDLIDSLRTENEKLKAQLADEVMYGYAGALYQMAEKLGITGARAASPQQVFETEVMPALLALIAERDRLAVDYLELLQDTGGLI